MSGGPFYILYDPLTDKWIYNVLFLSPDKANKARLKYGNRERAERAVIIEVELTYIKEVVR